MQFSSILAIQSFSFHYEMIHQLIDVCAATNSSFTWALPVEHAMKHGIILLYMHLCANKNVKINYIEFDKLGYDDILKASYVVVLTDDDKKAADFFKNINIKPIVYLHICNQTRFPWDHTGVFIEDVFPCSDLISSSLRLLENKNYNTSPRVAILGNAENSNVCEIIQRIIDGTKNIRFTVISRRNILNLKNKFPNYVDIFLKQVKVKCFNS